MNTLLIIGLVMVLAPSVAIVIWDVFGELLKAIIDVIRYGDTYDKIFAVSGVLVIIGMIIAGIGVVIIV